jgi:L-lactate dehydrogenase complex protein LldG
VTPAREAVLGRVRAALTVPGDDGPAVVPRAYRQAGDVTGAALVDLLTRRLEDYGTTVVSGADTRAAIEASLAAHGAGSVVVAADLPRELRPAGIDLVVDDGVEALALDACDAVVSTCAAACAETGTLALDGGPGQGRRAITLVPDLHVCVVRTGQLVQTVPELLDRLEPSAREGRPIVLVSGPSATSDIELARVEGVHGPRRLVVVIVQ